MNHEFFMNRALLLAENGTGFVSPNPKVGAVIVKNDQIVGEGWHKKFGEPHAEVEAINNSKLQNFEDCTLYVNLEPCNHYGKTPPCTDLIIKNKIPLVVVAMADPNPLVASRGLQKLRDAGIDVIVGVCEEEAKWLNRIFIKHITQKKPYILIKIAQTLDGCIALINGESKWISSEESRKRTHQLRNEFDSVLVGKNTVLKDNPMLTVRNVNGRNPMRIICDTNLSLPLDLAIFKLEDKSRTIVCCNDTASKSRKARNLVLSGANIVPCSVTSDGMLDINDILASLYDNFDITSIMVEGGAGIYSSFIKSGLADEMQVFTAPKVFGNCRSAFEYLSLKKVSNAISFNLKSVSMSGGDIHSIYTFH